MFARSSLAQTKRKLQSLETYLAIPSQYLYLIKKVAGFDSTADTLPRQCVFAAGVLRIGSTE